MSLISKLKGLFGGNGTDMGARMDGHGHSHEHGDNCDHDHADAAPVKGNCDCCAPDGTCQCGDGECCK